MPSAIQGPPGKYTAGLSFDYTQWTSNTVLTLANVPWNNDYRDIVRFASQAALDTYLEGTAGAQTINNVSYARLNAPVKINLPFNEVIKYNYLRAYNPAQPVPGGDVARAYYYFITDVDHSAPNTTIITVQLDVWQTFGYDITFGNCYIEQGHIGIANTNAFNNFGRDYLAIPEGLDTGAEYRTFKNLPIFDSFAPTVVVISAVDLSADPGDEQNPLEVTARGGTYFGVTMGADAYVFQSDGTFQAWMIAMQDKPWVTKNILSVTLVPNFAEWYPSFSFTFDPDGTIGPSNHPDLAPGNSLPAKYQKVKTNWRNSSDIMSAIPARYQGLKKFFTAPYMQIEITAYHGTPVVLRPENWNDPDASIGVISNMTPPDQRLVLSPRSYNASVTYTDNTSSAYLEDDGGDFLDTFTMIGDFPTVPIVNDEAIEYLAANKNGIAFQYSSAAWSQQKSLAGNQTSYDQASGAIGLGNTLAGYDQQQNSASRAIENNRAIGNAVIGGTVGVAGAIASGGLGASGAINELGSAASTAQNIMSNNQQTAMQNQFTRARNNAQQGQNSYVRDTNKSLADWSARGDYANTVAGINATVQDSKLTNPSMSGQLGGSTFNMVNGLWTFFIKWKLISPASLMAIGEYWLRYGYQVHKFGQMPANFMCMSNFTYWKLQETYVTSAPMPEAYKQMIRGIFEKGVTVWSNPANIGNIDIANNTPLGGISI